VAQHSSSENATLVFNPHLAPGYAFFQRHFMVLVTPSKRRKKPFSRYFQRETASARTPESFRKQKEEVYPRKRRTSTSFPNTFSVVMLLFPLLHEFPLA
jgi:hypothetical protein